MLVYWLLFLYFAVGAMREQPQPAGSARSHIPFRIGCVLMTLMIGLRYHVGADWIPYEEIFADAHTFKTLGFDKKPALLLGMNAMKAFKKVSIDFASRKLRVVIPEHSALDLKLAARLR